MPFQSIEHAEHNLVVIRLTGAIADRQLLRHYRERLEAGTLCAPFVELINGRAVGPFEITSGGHRRLMDRLIAHADVLKDMRWAFLRPARRLMRT